MGNFSRGIQSAEYAHTSESQTFGHSIGSTLTSLCKILIFINYFFSPFDHRVVSNRSWRPILDSLPEKLDMPTWTQIPCFIVLVLAPSVTFSVATLLKMPRRHLEWSSYLLQAAVILPTFLVLSMVVAVMMRSGTPIMTPDVQHHDPPSPPLNNPVANITTLVLQIFLAGLTNAALQQLSSSPPKSMQSHPLLHQAVLLLTLGLCKSDYVRRALTTLVQTVGLPGLSSPPPLSLETLSSSFTIFGTHEENGFLPPIRWGLSYIFIHLYPHLFSRPVLLFSSFQNFDVELRDPRDVYPSLPPKRGYRISGDYAIFGFICLAELAIGVVTKAVVPWLWMPLQQLKNTSAWFSNAAVNAKTVLGIATAMLQAAWAGDWAAAGNVASAAYADHRYGVFFVGINVVVIALAVSVGHFISWFDAYLASRSAHV